MKLPTGTRTDHQKPLGHGQLKIYRVERLSHRIWATLTLLLLSITTYGAVTLITLQSGNARQLFLNQVKMIEGETRMADLLNQWTDKLVTVDDILHKLQDDQTDLRAQQRVVVKKQDDLEVAIKGVLDVMHTFRHELQKPAPHPDPKH